MKQADGYVNEEKPNHVCRLMKSIYGVKQAARCCNSAMDCFLTSDGYRQIGADPCLCIKSIKRKNGKIDISSCG